MSLKVWLPLNGTLTQQGISNFTATNNGATVNTSGKIGSCYTFNGSSNYIYAPYNFYNSQYSVCAWIYTASTSATQAIVCDRTSTGLGFSIFLMNSGYMRLDPGGTTNSIQWTTQFNYPANTWFHLTVTYDGTYVAYYINGEFKEKLAKVISSTYWGTVTSIGASQANGSGYGNFLNGRLNDIRIYDHCLSAAEVREISQGLVMHYKLDGFFGGAGENLVINGDARNGLTGWSNWGTATSRQVITIGTKKWFNFKTDPNGNYGGFSQDRGIALYKPNTQYTISALMYASANASGRLWVHTRSTEGGANLAQYLTTVNVTTSPALYTFTFNTGSNASYTINKLNLMIGAVSTTSALDFYISNIKVEEGTKATTWVPCKEEGGYDTTKVEDSSGYNHNGTITGTISIDSDSPRYQSSVYVNGSSYILTPAGSFAWNDLTQLTFSAWMKPTASMTGWRGSVGIAADSNQTARGIAITDYGNEFRGTYTNGSGYQTVATGKTLTQNEWHHCAGTLNGTEFKLYFDGVLVKTQTIDWGTSTLNANARFEVGVDLPGTDEKFTGNYSDVRCYCTALDADAIRQLYEIGAKVDNQNNIHTFEFVEDQSTTKITKQGQFKCDEIIENTAAKLYNDNTIEAAEFIEI